MRSPDYRELTHPAMATPIATPHHCAPIQH
jgi:hypothetical protein